jgi:hypothetical protein
MLCAFVGMVENDLSGLCIRGNGKTMSMVYYLYEYKVKYHYQVWTNFYTTFSDKIIGLQEMIDKANELNKNSATKTKIVLGVTEMKQLCSHIGSKKHEAMFVSNFASQVRKLGIDMLFDTQILKDIHIDLRRHVENVRIPMKFHADGERCDYDRCMSEEHYVYIYSYLPWEKDPKKILIASKVAKLYNSQEFIEDKLRIPETA